MPTQPTTFVRKLFRRRWLFVGLFLILYIFLIFYFLDWEFATMPTFTLAIRNTRLPKNEVDLLIVIPSSPQERELRDMIRSTWLKNEKRNKVVRSLFTIATGQLPQGMMEYLRTEEEIAGDLLLINDIADSYYNISRKMLVTYEKIITELNIKFRYLLKADSDSWVNVQGLLARLDEDDVRSAGDMLHLGFFIGTGPVFRKGKWAEFTWNSCQHYLPYAAGGGYVLSYGAVKYIAVNSKQLRLFVNEDVNVGFWLAPLNVARIHDRRFNTEYKTRGCYNHYLISHPYKPEDIRSINRMFRESEGKRICDREYTVRKSYEYNWQVEPTACCIRTLNSL